MLDGSVLLWKMLIFSVLLPRKSDSDRRVLSLLSKGTDRTWWLRRRRKWLSFKHIYLSR